MRNDWSHLEQFRKLDGHRPSSGGDRFGVFYMPRGRVDFIILASEGDESAGVPWEHVSARAKDYKGERTPTWDEMCWLKDLFWNADECVVQFHPAKSDYVNYNPYVLHLWRPTKEVMPMPPLIAV